VPITPTEKIWMNGELVDWDDARIHVLTHTLHYGMGVFEGIRAYETPQGPAVFRLTEHMARMHNSAKIMGMELPYSVEELVQATKDVVRASGLPSAYIRPIAYYGYGEMGLNTLPCSVDVSIACWPWGAYLGEDAVTKGVRMKISSWTRHDHNTMPPAAKTTGNYVNSSLAKVEALKAGYDEAIMLSPQGFVSECTGENIFVARDGVLITPAGRGGRPRGHHPGHGDGHRQGLRLRGPLRPAHPQRPLRVRRDVRVRHRGRGLGRELRRRPRPAVPRPDDHRHRRRVRPHRAGRGRPVQGLVGACPLNLP
jgi:branched-chain amino acid aminotransferase